MRRMNGRTNWLIANGSARANTVYCTKEDSRTPFTDEHTDSGPWIYGIITNKGQRTDLTAVKEDIDSGVATVDLWEDHFPAMVRYHRSFSVYKRIKSTKRNWKMDIQVYWGPTNCSKTYTANELYGDSLYRLPPAKGSGTYWDDYQGETTVLIDEMYGNRFAFSFLLQLCDEYPFTVPVHGGAGHQFISKRIVFTSNKKPKKWYKEQFNYAAFARRITAITHMNVPYVAPGDIPLDVPVFPLFMELSSDSDDPENIAELGFQLPHWDEENNCWSDMQQRYNLPQDSE